MRFKTLLLEEFNREAFVNTAFMKAYPGGSKTLSTDKKWQAVLQKASYKISKNSRQNTRAEVMAAKSALKYVKAQRAKGVNTGLNDMQGQDDRDFFGYMADLDTSKEAEIMNAIKSNPEFSKIPGSDLVRSIGQLRWLYGGQIAKLSDKQKQSILDMVKSQFEDVPEDQIEDWIEDTDDSQNQNQNNQNGQNGQNSGSQDNQNQNNQNQNNQNNQNSGSQDNQNQNNQNQNNQNQNNQNQNNQNQNQNGQNGQNGPDSQNGQNSGSQDSQNQNSQNQNNQNQNQNGQNGPDSQNGQNSGSQDSQNSQDTEKTPAEKQREREIAEKIKKYNIPTDANGNMDLSNPETFKKISDAMLDGDSTLYNELLTKAGSEKSEYVKNAQEQIEKENKIKKEELENRKKRLDDVSKMYKAVAGIAEFFDVLASAMSGKDSDTLTKLVDRQTKIRNNTKVMKEQMEAVTGKFDPKEAETDHENEIKNIESNMRLELERLESSKTHPSDTRAFREKALVITQKYNQDKQALVQRSTEINNSIQKQNQIQSLLFKKDNAGLDANDDAVLKQLVPQKNNESPEDYEKRLKDPETFKKLEEEKSEIQREVESFNKKKEKLETEYNNRMKALEEEPDVKEELRVNNEDYENEKKRIEADAESLKARENKRHKDLMRVYKDIEKDNKKFCENMGVLMAVSSDPEGTAATEMLNRCKQIRSRLKAIGQDPDAIFGKGNLPETAEELEAFREKNKNKGKDSAGQRAIAVAQSKYKKKPLAKNRLDQFLKDSGITKDSDEDDVEDALEEFREQTFPKTITPESLSKIGITQVPKGAKDQSGKPIKDMKAYIDFLKSDSEALKKLKDDLGFDTDDDTDETAIPFDTGKFESVKNYLTGFKIKENGKDIAITAGNWSKYKNNKEVKKYLQSPSVLKKMSRSYISDEEDDIDDLNGTVETGKTKLADCSLKTLWTYLNNNGISIRVLPDYDSDWSDSEKEKAIREYLKKNKSSLTLPSQITEHENGTAERRLRAFAELLIDDLRTFG